MKTSTNNQTERRADNAQRFAALTPEALAEHARKINDTRILRAGGQIGEYALIGGEGRIVHNASGRTYECEDVYFFEDEVLCVGCDCPDELFRLAPLREAMDTHSISAPCYCKHYYARLLFQGAKIRTSRGITIKLKPKPRRAE